MSLLICIVLYHGRRIDIHYISYIYIFYRSSMTGTGNIFNCLIPIGIVFINYSSGIPFTSSTLMISQKTILNNNLRSQLVPELSRYNIEKAWNFCTVARPTLRGLRMPGVVERATQKPTPICLTCICRIQIQEP